MSGVRNILLPVLVCLVIASLFLFFTCGVFADQLASTWNVKYTNLKDALRVVAVDPLNPQVLYVGTDKGIMATLDGGATWGLLHSFKDNNLDLSKLVSEEALQSILFLREGEAAEPATTVRKAETGATESTAAEEHAAAQTADEAAIKQLEGLQAKLEKAQEDCAKAKEVTAQAQAAAKALPPDELTISEVESVPESDSGYVETVYMEQLEAWLSARALSVPDGGGERKDALMEYLKQHADKVAALETAAQEATVNEASLQNDLGIITDQVNQAKIATQQTETVLLAAKSASQTTEDQGKTAGEEGLEEPAGTPSPVIESVSGVTYVAIDPSDPDRILCATLNGLYLSSDKGESWNLVYRGTGELKSAIISLAIDPSNPATVYAGTLNGLNKSLDGGKTWEQASGRINTKVINYLVVHPFDSQIILAATQKDGIFKSSDGGVTWTRVFSFVGANNVHSLAYSASNPERIYAGTEAGIYLSKDGGSNWENITGLGLSSPLIHYLLTSPTDEDVAYAATLGGVFGTADMGKQWRKLTYGTMFRKPKFMAMDPLDPSSIFLLTENRLFRSEPLDVQDLSSGKKEITGNCEFLEGGAKHSLVILDVDPEAEIVTIEIRSDPQTIKLKVGEKQQLDLDQDGKDDVIIVAEEIKDGVPRLAIESLTAPEPEPEPAAVSTFPAAVNGLEDLQPYFQAEPTWVEVQTAASRWAEVHPDKIAGWRRGASLRAFLPRISLAYTKSRAWYDDSYSRNENYQSTESSSYQQSSSETKSSGGSLYTTQYSDGNYNWYDEYSSYDESSYYEKSSSGKGQRAATGNRYKESLNYVKSKSWRLEFSWYLGDFLYERQQIYISKEARDLVELRQDVLEQVTQYFFDRRSARIDLILNPPADSYSRVEALLMIQQLNASLDALTGGYFSRTIKEKSRSL